MKPELRLDRIRALMADGGPRTSAQVAAVTGGMTATAAGALLRLAKAGEVHVCGIESTKAKVYRLGPGQQVKLPSTDRWPDADPVLEVAMRAMVRVGGAARSTD